jgi:hypothetical protein
VALVEVVAAVRDCVSVRFGLAALLGGSSPVPTRAAGVAVAALGFDSALAPGAPRAQVVLAAPRLVVPAAPRLSAGWPGASGWPVPDRGAASSGVARGVPVDRARAVRAV